MSIYLLNEAAQEEKKTLKSGAIYIGDSSNSLFLYRKSFEVIIQKMESVSALLSNISIIYSMADKNDENEKLFEKHTKSVLQLVEKVIDVYKSSVCASDFQENQEVIDIALSILNTMESIKWRIELFMQCRKESYAKQIIDLCSIIIKIIEKAEL